MILCPAQKKRQEAAEDLESDSGTDEGKSDRLKMAGHVINAIRICISHPIAEHTYELNYRSVGSFEDYFYLKSKSCSSSPKRSIISHT